MMFTVEVIETRTVRCLYDIDADTREEALEKAQCGETVAEVESGFAAEVIARDVDATTLEQNEDD